MEITNDKSLSILIIPGLFPFPPDAGGKICVFAFIDSLRHQHNIHLFLSVYDETQKQLVELYKKKLSNVTIHTIEVIASKKTKLKNQLKKFVSHFFLREFQTYSDIDDVGFTSTVTLHSKAFVIALSELISKVKFDIIQTEYISMLNIVNIIPQNIKKIYVEIESRHAVLYDYGKAKNIDPVYIRYIYENAKNIELTYMKKYDAVFTLNDEDNIYLTKQLPGVKIFTSPFPVLDEDRMGPDGFNNIDKLVFVGGEGHEPNHDAVLWLAKNILPEVNLKHNLKLYVTGYWSPKTIKQVKALNNNIEFTGFINNISDFLRSGISVIPIRIGGGGLRTKIIYSLAAGSPVITTPIAAYGLVKEAHNSYLIANTYKEFADQIDLVISDPQVTQTLIENGRKIIQQFYSQKIVSQKRNRFYFEILEDGDLSKEILSA